MTKKIKRNGQPSVTSRRAFVGRCCHNKMRQLYGKRQIKGIVTLQGTLLHTKTTEFIIQNVLASDELTVLFCRKSGPELCGHDPESPYYQPLNPCISGTRSQRWIPIEHRTTWPSQARQNSTELDIHGRYLTT